MKLKKDFDISAFFIRRFPKFRELEERCRELEERCRELEKKSESDAGLIESLYRYTEALEGKAAYQAELAQKLREKLNAMLAAVQKAP